MGLSISVVIGAITVMTVIESVVALLLAGVAALGIRLARAPPRLMIWLPFGIRKPEDITFPFAPLDESKGIRYINEAAARIDTERACPRTGLGCCSATPPSAPGGLLRPSGG